jgi:hypothetical protein
VVAREGQHKERECPRDGVIRVAQGAEPSTREWFRQRQVVDAETATHIVRLLMES